MATDRNEPAAPTRRVLQRWVHRRLGSLDHERRVAHIADTIFTLTRARHGLGESHRRLLALAAIVHDVGRANGDDGHEIAGAKMLLRTDALPLTLSQRRALAYLTRYHRGPVPEAGADGILLSRDDHRALRVTLALLRAADGLDSRSLDPPRIVFVLRRDRLHVACYLNAGSARARKAFCRRKKFRLLEQLIGCRIDIDLCFADALSLVA